MSNIGKTTNCKKTQRILDWITGITLGILFITYVVFFVQAIATAELVLVVKYQMVIYVITGVVTIAYMLLTIKFRSISRREVAKLKNE